MGQSYSHLLNLLYLLPAVFSVSQNHLVMPPEQKLLPINIFLSKEHTREAIHTVHPVSISFCSLRQMSPTDLAPVGVDHYESSEKTSKVESSPFKSFPLMPEGLYYPLIVSSSWNYR